MPQASGQGRVPVQHEVMVGEAEEDGVPIEASAKRACNAGSPRIARHHRQARSARRLKAGADRCLLGNRVQRLLVGKRASVAVQAARRAFRSGTQ